MATGKSAQIADALLARANSLSVGVDVVFDEEGETFTPPESGKYLVVELLDNVPRWEGLSAGDKLDQGLLQITVVWPKNDGNIRPREVVNQVMDHFPKELALFSGSTKVTITGEAYYTSIKEPDKVRFPITIPWMA